MTVRAALLAALFVSACATPAVETPRPVAALPPAAPSATRAPLDAAAQLARAGQADAITPREAGMLLGPPDVERREGAGALLTWRLESCALVLSFTGDRLQSVSPGPRRSGAPAPSIETCVSEAQARLTTS
jgi:hypothetical protein